MRIALVQHQPGPRRDGNVTRGLDAVREAAGRGASLVAFPELAFTPFFPSCRCEGALPLNLAETVPGPTSDAFCPARGRTRRRRGPQSV